MSGVGRPSREVPGAGGFPPAGTGVEGLLPEGAGGGGSRVYRTRAHRWRQRTLYALAAVGLLLVGYLIGRWQDSPAPAVALPPVPSAAAGGPASAVAEEPSAEPTTSPPPTPTVYPTLQAEAADEKVGIEAQDTEDQGGGQNVGWIANGDRLRFDDFQFGEVPATKVDVRVATDAQDGGRMEIRLDSADGPVIGTMRVTRTGGWQTWRTDEVTLIPTTGRHTVYLVFARDDGSEFLNVNWLLFGH